MFFPGSEFPFAYENQTDPFTGKSDGILARCTASYTCPKVIHLNSGTEYWQAGQSLVTTDPLGQRDTTPPSNVRIWLPYNLTDYRPLMRGALVALDRWVKDGTSAPASRYPRIADGALVRSVKLNPAIPGLAMAKGPNEKPRLDFGPDIDKGIISKALPVALKDRYGVLVPSVDTDGNETAGLALPDITVPTGTAMGWSVRSEFGGGTGELCYLDGAFIPFAKTKAEREATKDPRPSLAERYRDNADYSERVKAAATALERDGYLLPEDTKRIVERAHEAVMSADRWARPHGGADVRPAHGVHPLRNHRCRRPAELAGATSATDGCWHCAVAMSAEHHRAIEMLAGTSPGCTEAPLALLGAAGRDTLETMDALLIALQR